jgi:hypothetical protein
MSREPKPRPTFESEVDERASSETHDSTGRVDWAAAERARFPNLRA